MEVGAGGGDFGAERFGVVVVDGVAAIDEFFDDGEGGVGVAVGGEADVGDSGHGFSPAS